jgi:hypothetical protein
MQQSPHWTPPPGTPKAAVGSIWATVRTNLDEWVSATVFLEKVFITTDGGIQHPHPTRRDVALPILGYRTVEALSSRALSVVERWGIRRPVIGGIIRDDLKLKKPNQFGVQG